GDKATWGTGWPWPNPEAGRSTRILNKVRISLLVSLCPCLDWRLFMRARFFIDRPVLAWVISIVIILLGGIAAALLPIAEYPEITPPNVRVTANYPGANAKVVADTVAAPIEQQVVGVEGMLYMSSNSNNDGSYTLDVTFELGTNVNMAQVLVQNRVAIAEPTLPDAVRASG